MNISSKWSYAVYLPWEKGVPELDAKQLSDMSLTSEQAYGKKPWHDKEPEGTDLLSSNDRANQMVVNRQAQ